MYSDTVLSLNIEENFFLKSGLRVWTKVGPAGTFEGHNHYRVRLVHYIRHGYKLQGALKATKLKVGYSTLDITTRLDI